MTVRVLTPRAVAISFMSQTLFLQLARSARCIAGSTGAKRDFHNNICIYPRRFDYARQIETKIILVDGFTLAEYMIDNGVGVSRFAMNIYKDLKIELAAQICNDLFPFSFPVIGSSGISLKQPTSTSCRNVCSEMGNSARH